MKKKTSKHQESRDRDMLPEYNFEGGVRGKHHSAYCKGHTVKIHKIDGTISIQQLQEDSRFVTAKKFI